MISTFSSVLVLGAILQQKKWPLKEKMDAYTAYIAIYKYGENSDVKSYKVGRHVTEHHKLPYLKIESNYSSNDEGQIRTKIEALFEIVGKQ